MDDPTFRAMSSARGTLANSGAAGARTEAQRKWNRARQQAFWRKLQANLAGKEISLLDFNAVSHRLKLRNTAYRGTHNIPLDQIVGSMGRYHDFTREFLPIQESMGERWRDVAVALLDINKGGLPPIEVYKVGEWYFVKDGNHRCSVARQLGNKYIEAYVWEYTDRLPEYNPEEGIDCLLLEAEHKEFLEETCLNSLRPAHDVRLSAAGGYMDLQRQILHYQDVLSQIDQVETPYEEAVGAWYDMIFEPSVQLIRDSGVLDLFPERTSADFFVWIMAHRDELQQRYGGSLMVNDAARVFLYKHPRSLLSWARYLLGWLFGRK